MDSRLSWKGDTKFSDRLCHGTDPQSGHWINGGICYCQTALIHCVLIPLFKTFSSIHLYNNLLGLIIPYVTFSLPITIYIMEGFFENMPQEIFEAACIDGCSIYKCFTSVAVPLSKTGLFVTGLMSFVANWNELLLAMVFISDDLKKTLPVSLSKFVGPYNTNYVQMFAAIIIAIIPTIIVYCCFSNQIVDGLTAGAVKG